MVKIGRTRERKFGVEKMPKGGIREQIKRLRSLITRVVLIQKKDRVFKRIVKLGWDYYRNLTADDFLNSFDFSCFESFEFEYNPVSHDLSVVGILS